jgi:hypothetical protein
MPVTTAFRANRPIWPPGGLKPLPSGFFIVEMGLCELVLGHLKTSLMAGILAFAACGVNYVFHPTRYGFVN